VAVVQYTFTHKPYTEYTERNTHNNKKKKKLEVRAVSRFASYNLAFALQPRKKHGKASVRVEKASVVYNMYSVLFKVLKKLKGLEGLVVPFSTWAIQ
jgi:hypothetical protein